MKIILLDWRFHKEYPFELAEWERFFSGQPFFKFTFSGDPGILCAAAKKAGEESSFEKFQFFENWRSYPDVVDAVENVLTECKKSFTKESFWKELYDKVENLGSFLFTEGFDSANYDYEVSELTLTLKRFKKQKYFMDSIRLIDLPDDLQYEIVQTQLSPSGFGVEEIHEKGCVPYRVWK